MITTRILGSTGMLGSMVERTWEGPMTSISRDAFDAESPSYHWYKEGDWVINCIGVIKPYCGDVVRAIKVNALFPHTLPSRTIQIATDCVYSGKKGDYVETDVHDATDVYGQTKSLGEASHVKNLRCSIIGPEVNHHVSLLDWFLGQDKAQGFTNHYWNGITTYHFSKIVQGIIREGIDLLSLQHVVPADKVTKADLLRIIKKAYGRKTTVTNTEAPESIDRTLSTVNPKLNQALWRAAGYSKPPTIKQMIEELAAL